MRKDAFLCGMNNLAVSLAAFSNNGCDCDKWHGADARRYEKRSCRTEQPSLNEERPKRARVLMCIVASFVIHFRH
jgi:hypothetical protein